MGHSCLWMEVRYKVQLCVDGCKACALFRSLPWRDCGMTGPPEGVAACWGGSCSYWLEGETGEMLV